MRFIIYGRSKYAVTRPLLFLFIKFRGLFKPSFKYYCNIGKKHVIYSDSVMRFFAQVLLLLVMRWKWKQTTFWWVMKFAKWVSGLKYGTCSKYKLISTLKKLIKNGPKISSLKKYVIKTIFGRRKKLGQFFSIIFSDLELA